MKSVLLGTLLMILISAGAALVLDTQATTATDAYTSQNGSVRIGN